jgi:hypothetical protein
VGWDDTFDAVHGGQRLRLFNAYYEEYGFQPIVVFDADGRPVAAVLRRDRIEACRNRGCRRFHRDGRLLSSLLSGTRTHQARGPPETPHEGRIDGGGGDGGGPARSPPGRPL